MILNRQIQQKRMHEGFDMSILFYVYSGMPNYLIATVLFLYFWRLKDAAIEILVLISQSFLLWSPSSTNIKLNKSVVAISVTC